MRHLLTAIIGFCTTMAAMAQIPPADGTGSAPVSSHHAAAHSSFSTMIMLTALIVIFWFFIMRPQMRRNKEQKNTLNSLAVGDEIVTIAGIFGHGYGR